MISIISRNTLAWLRYCHDTMFLNIYSFVYMTEHIAIPHDTMYSDSAQVYLCETVALTGTFRFLIISLLIFYCCWYILSRTTPTHVTLHHVMWYSRVGSVEREAERVEHGAAGDERHAREKVAGQVG